MSVIDFCESLISKYHNIIFLLQYISINKIIFSGTGKLAIHKKMKSCKSDLNRSVCCHVDGGRIAVYVVKILNMLGFSWFSPAK